MFLEDIGVRRHEQDEAILAEHQHSGLAPFTPAEVFFGRIAAVLDVRQAALDAHYAEHPERFPNGPPQAALPPAEVHINPLEIRAAVDESNAAASAVDATINRLESTPSPAFRAYHPSNHRPASVSPAFAP